MTFRIGDREIARVGVVGSGQIGPDIALYFAKALAPHGVRVVVNDIVQAALDGGRAKTTKKIEKGVSMGAFAADQAREMLDALVFTSEKSELRGSGLVVEAATEDLAIKRRIFRDLEESCGPDAVLTSNSSHLEPEVIFRELKRPQRALVTHYFFPAERNPVVEIVPGKLADAATSDFVLAFYEAIGKVPVRVGSRYGYAIDPIFEGIFLAALLLADAGVASPKQIDFVAQEALGLGVGPFTAMNLTGGNPITRIGLQGYHDAIAPWFHAPASLEAQKDPWPAAGPGEKVEVDGPTREAVTRALRGAYFGLAAEVASSGILGVDDLDMAAELALVLNPPFRMMNDVGVANARALVEEYAARHAGFPVAPILHRSEPWRIRRVFRHDVGDVAVVTIRRPKVLNALDRDLYAELDEVFRAIEGDRAIRAAVLTGFGVKAFVSGADIGMLAAVKSPAEGEALSWSSQEACLRIEKLSKPVVAALNGLALGGGSELALSCMARIARAGLPLCFGQPEVRLGIIPGSGATQRLPRVVGFDAAWEILRTGRNVSGAEALKLGYIREEVPGEGTLVPRAVALARELAASAQKRPDRGPVRVPDVLPRVDIGPLSKKADEILQKAIVLGLKKPLEEGLRFESRCFGEICGTKDMRVGIENFMASGGKRPAPFVHA